MAWTQADLDAIDAAIAGNVRSVTYADGRQITYQDADKMLAVRNTIRAELLASASAVTPRTRTIYARFGRR